MSMVERAEALLGIIDTIVGDLGPAGSDGWTDGYVHVTDLDRLKQAVIEMRAALTDRLNVGEGIPSRR